MAILLADTLGKTDAREIYNDPGGRGLAISARIHNRPTIIIAYHADSHSDEEQRDGFLALKSALPHDPTCDYIWLMDRNNIPNETLDYKHAQGAPNSIQRPLGIAAMHGCATHWGGMRDASTGHSIHGAANSHDSTHLMENRVTGNVWTA